MRGIRGENVPEVAATGHQDPVEAFAGGRCRPRARRAGRAFGARTGALITRAPLERKTSSKLTGDLAVSLADEESTMGGHSRRRASSARCRPPAAPP